MRSDYFKNTAPKNNERNDYILEYASTSIPTVTGSELRIREQFCRSQSDIIESGENNNTTSDILKKVAKALEIDLDELTKIIMHCIHCWKNIPSDSKFCQFCGKTLPAELLKDIPIHDKTQCDICGMTAPTKYNEFYANIGMLVARRQMSVKGNMCKNCTNKYFWKYTLTNLFLGWWGVISFFATILFILNNTFRFLGTLTLKKYY